MDENFVILLLLVFILFSVAELLYFEWKFRQSPPP
jgi:hypothetical protein